LRINPKRITGWGFSTLLSSLPQPDFSVLNRIIAIRNIKIKKVKNYHIFFLFLLTEITNTFMIIDVVEDSGIEMKSREKMNWIF